MTGSCRARCGEGHAVQGHGRCRRWTAFVLRSVRRFWRFLSLALAALGLAARTHIPVGSRNRNTRLDMSADISRKQPARPGGGYADSFVEHYILPLLYPELLFPGGFSRSWFIWIGIFVLGLNGLIYCQLWAKHRRQLGNF